MKTKIIQGFIAETRASGIKFTMDDLSKRLGMSKRTIYEHFSSKLQILESILDLTTKELAERSREITENKTLTLQEKVGQMISIIPEHNEFYDLRILEQLKRFYPEQWERVNDELQQWNELKVLLIQGMEAGLIRNQNIDLLMKVIMNAIAITFDQAFFSEHSISNKEAISEITELILYGIVHYE